MPIRKRIITDEKEIEKIISKCPVCFIGMAKENLPYVLPFNFGYEKGFFWIHGTQTGKKIDYIRNNNQVCIALETDSKLHLRHETMACSYSMVYKSIVAMGRAEIVEEYEEKVRGMDIIMHHYTDLDFTYSKPSIDNVALIRIKVDELVCHDRSLS